MDDKSFDSMYLNLSCTDYFPEGMEIYIEEPFLEHSSSDSEEAT